MFSGVSWLVDKNDQHLQGIFIEAFAFYDFTWVPPEAVVLWNLAILRSWFPVQLRNHVSVFVGLYVNLKSTFELDEAEESQCDQGIFVSADVVDHFLQKYCIRRVITVQFGDSFFNELGVHWGDERIVIFLGEIAIIRQ